MGKGLKRDIWVLAGCWATVLTASTLITSASPLAAVSIGINRSVAPFTIGMFLIGAALISAYSAQIFTALGRAKGFGFGCALGLAGGVLGAYAYTAIGWDGLVYVVCGLMGLAGIFLAGSYRAASRRADGPEGSKSGSLSFTISPMTGGCPAPAGMVEPWGKSVSSTSV